ncbi:MAG: SDR family oxidoreductase [Ignavibacteriales bacterium]|nr:SDR family oxidoreductase [Ignavibacteriales bacterium]
MSKSKWSLEGKRAVITGGTKGIGRATAEEFLDLGAEVLVVARSERDVSEATEEWTRNGKGAAYGVAADVTTEEGRDAVFERVKKLWASFDALVNNAGTNIRKPSIDYDREEYDAIVELNQRATYEMCKRSYPYLEKSGESAVVNVTSVGGLTHVGTGAPYAMSKAAIEQMTRNLAVEWASDGIRVNAVSPWYIDTPLTHEKLSNPDYLDAVLKRTPMKRVGEPKEVAAAIAFFVMNASSYVTGRGLSVDGGFMAYGFSSP